jgi:hypothetical protein
MRSNIHFVHHLDDLIVRSIIVIVVAAITLDKHQFLCSFIYYSYFILYFHEKFICFQFF